MVILIITWTSGKFIEKKRISKMQNTPKEKNKRIKQNATMLILKMLKFILSARVVSVKFSLKHMKALLSNYKLVRTLTSITFPDSFHFVEKYCAEFF